MRRLAWVLMALLLSGCTMGSSVDNRPPGGPAEATVGPDLCLTAVRMIDDRTGWVQARREAGALVLLRTTDGGWGWADATPPELLAAKAGNATFASFFPDGQTGWVAMTTLLESRSVISVARTTDGGKRWAYSAIPVLKAETGSLRLQFTSPQLGWLLVTSGPQLGTMHKSVYRTEDGGATWGLVSRNDWPGARATPGALPNVEYVTGLSARNDLSGWVTDIYRSEREIPLYWTQSGGRSWERQPLGYPPAFADALYANAYPPVFFGADAEAGVLLVEFRSDDPAVLAFRTDDGGNSWEPAGTSMAGYPADPYSHFYDFPDAAHGFVMLGETLYATRDGGQTWSASRLPLLKDSQLNFVSERVGWATESGCSRSFYRTGDGGATWLPVRVTAPKRKEAKS
jgi:photosystem II stability/assembly factor-like uncharacterized protein